MQNIIVAFIFSVTLGNVFANPGKYWVFFTDKDGVVFNPYSYFDGKAIERKKKSNIPLDDLTDRPVNSQYLEKIRPMVDSLGRVTRWFNAVAVWADSKQIEKIIKLPFVKNADEMQRCATLAFFIPAGTKDSFTGQERIDASLSSADLELLRRQTARLDARDFTSRGIDGKGIRIAVFDAGFPDVDVNPVFEHIRKDNQIKMTWDFIRDKENVYGHSTHGAMVLSCIAGIYKDTLYGNGAVNIGLATGAEFLLARTESGTWEPYSEEENWLAAAEWADKNGADIISSSLGYTYNRYFTSDMDGHKSLVARAANMAAQKGMLVVNAAGNDGDNGWKFIGTPADADSVLSVGGISPQSDIHINFSSYGPTADKRLKPNVCAFAQVIAAGKKGLQTVFGTSFSTPLIAGFSACAWQVKKDLDNMQLFLEIEKSADLYPYYDYAHGYGTPQANYFTGEKQTAKPTFEFAREGETLIIRIKNNPQLNDDDNILRNTDNSHSQKLLYYHIENNKGVLDKYYVIFVKQEDVLQFQISDYAQGEKLCVHFMGYTETYSF